jgi:hypothetical protein
MSRYCFRITFQTEEAAFYQFHVFPPVSHLNWILGWARKRNGNSQLVLLELKSEEFRDRFLELCCENPQGGASPYRAAGRDEFEDDERGIRYFLERRI